MNRTKFLLLSLLVFFNINTIKAISNNTIDFDSKGSIEITLIEKNDNETIKDAEITIYKVAQAKEENHNLIFEYVSDLSGCDVSLKELDELNISSSIEKCMPSSMIGITATTDNKGKAKYDQLDLGLYLVKQTKKVEGFSKIDSFLVMIPENIDNKWIYKIEAIPKTEISKEMNISVRKIWNTSTSNTNHKIDIPKKVTIQLLLKNEIIDTITLTKENNWEYTWENLIKSDLYEVKEINIPSGYTVTYQKNDNTFIVTNTSSLVQTGQMVWLAILIGLIGLVLVIFSIVYNKVNNE